MNERKGVVYGRVSSHGQKDDLESQVKAMNEYCINKGLAVDELIEESDKR